MTRLRLIGSAVLLSLSSMAMADSASQAEQFLKLVHADKLTVPVYAQVQQVLAQRFAQARRRRARRRFSSVTRPRPMPSWTAPSAGTRSSPS